MKSKMYDVKMLWVDAEGEPLGVAFVETVLAPSPFEAAMKAPGQAITNMSAADRVVVLKTTEATQPKVIVPPSIINGEGNTLSIACSTHNLTPEAARKLADELIDFANAISNGK